MIWEHTAGDGEDDEAREDGEDRGEQLRMNRAKASAEPVAEVIAG